MALLDIARAWLALAEQHAAAASIAAAIPA
jgi:hypothetical protein